MKPHSVKTAPGCIFTLLLFVLTVTFLNPSNALSQDADHYFRFGMELKEKGSYEEAVEAFKDAIGKDHKFAEAYNQLAQCYLFIPHSAAILKRASEAALEAKRLDRDNKEYVYTLADVYFARNFLHDARRLLDNILNDDPGDIPSLSRFAKYKLWEYEQYRYRRDRLTIRFRVASSHLTEANQFMDRVLEIDPAHRETVLLKASMSLDEGNFDEFIDYMSRLLDKNENDLEASLYMGLAYSNKGDFETALKYYDKAYILMTPEERDVLENPEQLDALIDIDSYGNFKLIPAVETEYFWDKKDPFYLTGINERKLIHYGRVAEANLRFSIPSDGIPGWQTARGIVWIKYGKPFSIRGSYNHNKFENILTWTYENFMFNFLAGYNAAWRNDYVFKIKSFMPGPWTVITNEDVLVGGNTERIVIDLPEKYVYDPPGELFEIAVDVLNYRGTGGKTDVDIYIGIPINKIGWESDSENYYAEIEQGIFIHDSDWNRVVESTGTVSLQFGKDDFDISSSKILIGENSYEIEPGVYNLSVEASESVSGNAGVTRDSITVEKFGYESLQMSDILVATNIIISNRQQPVSRENLLIVGEPRHVFLKDDPFYIYYELYNLSLINEQEDNNYKMEYSFRQVDTDNLQGIRPQTLIRNLPLKPLSRQIETWVSSEIPGRGPTDFNVLRIDHNLNVTGMYELILRITDTQTGMTVIKSTPIIIY